MKSFYGGNSSGFSSIEGYESQWRHRNILFTPVPRRDISGQPVSAWTFNLDNPAVGLKQNDLSEQAKEFMLYNNLYDEKKVNNYVNSARGDPNFPGWGKKYLTDIGTGGMTWSFNYNAPSLIYFMIIGNMAGYHADINREVNYNTYIFSDKQMNTILKKDQILKKRADYYFLNNLITEWPNMSQSDKLFFKEFVQVQERNTTVTAPGGPILKNISLDDVELSKIDESMKKYKVTILFNKVINALPELPNNTYLHKDSVKKVYDNVYNYIMPRAFRGYVIPPPGSEFLTMFNYVGFMEKIMDSGLPSKVSDDYARKLFSEDDLTKIITEIGVIKEIWFRDADGDLAYKDNNGNPIKLNNKDKKKVIDNFFNVSRDTCMGTYFDDPAKCNEFIFKCINHTGYDGNLKKCIEFITKTNNFPNDIKKVFDKVQPKRALNFLRALGYRVKTIGNVDKIQNWNEWMTEVVEQSGLPANDIKGIVENDNLKRLLTYFVEYINANPAILNKNYDSSKHKVKSLDECPYPWIKKLGVPAISRNMKYVKNISDSTNSLYQLLFNSITKPKQVTKQSLFGNNSFGLFNSLSSFAPLLLMGTTLIGGSQKMTFPYFNKDVIRQMNGGNNILSNNSLLNILPINMTQHDDHNNINLFYKHIDSVVQHQRNRNMNIFSDAEVNELKNLIKDLDNLIQKIQKKMGKLELVNQLINSGFPGIEKLIPLNDKLMEKIVVYVNTVYNGEYNVKNLLNSIVTAMLEQEVGSINLRSKPITSI